MKKLIVTALVVMYMLLPVMASPVSASEGEGAFYWVTLLPFYHSLTGLEHESEKIADFGTINADAVSHALLVGHVLLLLHSRLLPCVLLLLMVMDSAGWFTSAAAHDEDLADATVVMAGIGPLLLRASYREGIAVSGNKAEWNVRRTGSLHPVAIAYLTLVQAEMAGLHADARRSLIGDWLEPAWSVRARVQ